MKTSQAALETTDTMSPDTWRPPTRAMEPWRSEASADPERRGAPSPAPTLRELPAAVLPPALAGARIFARGRTEASGVHSVPTPSPSRDAAKTVRPAPPRASGGAPRPSSAEPARSIAPASVRSAVAASSQPPRSGSMEQTICAGCRNVTRTQRASTLSALGWRLGFFRGQADGHGQRWFCPECRDGIAATLTQPPASVRKG